MISIISKPTISRLPLIGFLGVKLWKYGFAYCNPDGIDGYGYSPNDQFITNPRYDQHRVSVHAFGLRAHAEF